MSEQPTHAMLVRADDGLHLLPACSARKCAERTVTFVTGADVLGIVELYPEPIPGVQFWSAVQLGKAPKTAVDTDDASGNHKLDTDTHVFFYEQDFYVLSNFSAFTLEWRGYRFDTSEAAYHFEKFVTTDRNAANAILLAPSAHEAFKIAERCKEQRRADWDEVKLDVMREILRAKADQHEYVRRKLLATGDRILVEDSWRDSYWGWGPNRDGQNMLGKLWMEVRAAIAAEAQP